MDKTFTLREMAKLIAQSDEQYEIEATFQILRGWANPARSIITGRRTGKTSAVLYTLSEVCRAAVLLTLRRSLGVEGESLLEFGEKLTQYRRVNVGPGPHNSNVVVNFGALISAMSRGEDWRFVNYTLRNKLDGSIANSFEYGPARLINGRDDTSDPHYKILTFFEIHLLELLGPIFEAAPND